MTHLLSFFLLFSFFHCTLSLLDPQDDVGFLVEPDDVNILQNNSKRCDFSVGKWVYDESYPLYDPNCPYLSTAVTCQKNGRPDSDYEKWKWKPSACSIPRSVHIATFLFSSIHSLYSIFIYLFINFYFLIFSIYMIHRCYTQTIEI